MVKPVRSSKSKKGSKRARKERQFFPESSIHPIWVRGALGLGAALLGAGGWEQFFSTAPVPFPGTPWLLTAGVLLLAAGTWLSTSSGPVLRVGDGGLALVRSSGLRRMAWHALDSVTWSGSSGDGALIVKGRDETEKELSLTVSLKNQRHAAAAIVDEARTRVPAVIDLPESAIEEIERKGRTGHSDAVDLPLEPVQVVGKHCAASGKVIAYEPDARVCSRCERVYHKSHVPAVCACGGSLAGLQPAAEA